MNQGFIQAKAGCGHNDLLPGIQDAQKSGKQGLTGTHRHQYLLSSHRVAPGSFVIGDGLPQLHGSLIGGIVGQSCVQGINGSSLDGLRGIKIRFADGQHGAVRGLAGQIGEDANLAPLELIEIVV